MVHGQRPCVAREQKFNRQHFHGVCPVTSARALAAPKLRVPLKPYRLRGGNLKFTAPLTAITPAVVVVIVNLAVFFALHVLWPHGIKGGFEWPSLLIGLAAGIALFRFKLGVIPVVLACGVIGLALRVFVL